MKESRRYRSNRSNRDRPIADILLLQVLTTCKRLRFVTGVNKVNRRATIVVRSSVNKAVSVPKEAEGGAVQCYSTLQEDPSRSRRSAAFFKERSGRFEYQAIFKRKNEESCQIERIHTVKEYRPSGRTKN